MTKKQSDNLNSDSQGFQGEIEDIDSLNHSGWTVSVEVGARSHGWIIEPDWFPKVVTITSCGSVFGCRKCE